MCSALRFDQCQGSIFFCEIIFFIPPFFVIIFFLTFFFIFPSLLLSFIPYLYLFFLALLLESFPPGRGGGQTEKYRPLISAPQAGSSSAASVSIHLSQQNIDNYIGPMISNAVVKGHHEPWCPLTVSSLWHLKCCGLLSQQNVVTTGHKSQNKHKQISISSPFTLQLLLCTVWFSD